MGLPSSSPGGREQILNSVKSLYSTHCCSLFLRDYKITEPPILTEKKREVTSDILKGLRISEPPNT